MLLDYILTIWSLNLFFFNSIINILVNKSFVDMFENVFFNVTLIFNKKAAKDVNFNFLFIILIIAVKFKINRSLIAWILNYLLILDFF